MMMAKGLRLFLVVTVVFIGTLGSGPASRALADKGHDVRVDRAEEYFTDTVLLDQDGQSRRFYSDLIKGRKVVINFGFTSCKTVCSMAASNLQKVRRILASHKVTDVLFLTLSVDPEGDTPEVLKVYAKRFGADANWRFLTGKPQDLELITRRLGAATQEPATHKTTLLMGDMVSGQWAKSFSMETPDKIAYAIEHLGDEKI